jgi:hypothetical protein
MPHLRQLPRHTAIALIGAAATFAAVLALTALAGAQGGGDAEPIGNTEDTPKPS